MKKQILFFAVSISAIVLVSCSKERVETPSSNQLVGETNSQGQKQMGASSLVKGLEGLYEFNSNIKESTGKLADAVPSTPGADIYAEDRFGQPEKAIRFVGRYGLDILNLPAAGINMSIAAWVKYDSSNLNTNFFLKANAVCPEFAQQYTSYYGVITTPMTSSVQSGPINNKWHHLVATYDGTDLKFYVDGSYVGVTNNPAGGVYPPGFTANYQLGYMTYPFTKDIASVWYGYVDDLRFYSRVLSAKEAQALYNL